MAVIIIKDRINQGRGPSISPSPVTFQDLDSRRYLKMATKSGVHPWKLERVVNLKLVFWQYSLTLDQFV